MRRLTGLVAAVVLAVPGSCLALGLGDIEPHSALNQTLDASINLFSTEGLSDLAQLEADVVAAVAPTAHRHPVGVERTARQ